MTGRGRLAAGETAELVLRASDNAGRHVRGGAAVARVWAPGTDPGTDAPFRELSAAWDERRRGYVVLADTTGWPPGTYTARGEVRGETPAGTARGTSGPVTFRVG